MKDNDKKKGYVIIFDDATTKDLDIEKQRMSEEEIRKRLLSRAEEYLMFLDD